MEVLTGLSDPHEAARRLHEWGVKEVLVTLGSMGSLIFNGTDFFRIPAYKPAQVVDATGCGDTYTIGYLYQRVSGTGIEEAGRFDVDTENREIRSFQRQQRRCRPLHRDSGRNVLRSLLLFHIGSFCVKIGHSCIFQNLFCLSFVHFVTFAK